VAGHNKWSKIKRLKEKNDAEKSKIFGKLLRAVSVEAKKTGGTMSPSLRAAMDKAREANVPSDNIERAIKKAGESDALESIIYEAYGPGGAALIIEALTGNKNKAAQEIKHILGEHGYSLAAIGGATWAFEKTSEGWTPKTTTSLSDEDEKKLGELISNLEENEEVQEVFTNAE